MKRQMDQTKLELSDRRKLSDLPQLMMDPLGSD